MTLVGIPSMETHTVEYFGYLGLANTIFSYSLFNSIAPLQPVFGLLFYSLSPWRIFTVQLIGFWRFLGFVRYRIGYYFSLVFICFNIQDFYLLSKKIKNSSEIKIKQNISKEFLFNIHLFVLYAFFPDKSIYLWFYAFVPVSLSAPPSVICIHFFKELGFLYVYPMTF
jgi:hypothetical protein